MIEDSDRLEAAPPTPDDDSRAGRTRSVSAVAGWDSITIRWRDLAGGSKIIVAGAALVVVAAMVIVITSSGVSSLNARVSACFGYKVTGCHVLATVDGQATGVCDGGYEFGEESGSVSC